MAGGKLSREDLSLPYFAFSFLGVLFHNFPFEDKEYPFKKVRIREAGHLEISAAG